MSKTVQDRAIVTVEHQYEVIYELSNGIISSDLQSTVMSLLLIIHFLFVTVYQTSCINDILETLPQSVSMFPIDILSSFGFL